jgi:hypothetical protein
MEDTSSVTGSLDFLVNFRVRELARMNNGVAIYTEKSEIEFTY